MSAPGAKFHILRDVEAVAAAVAEDAARTLRQALADRGSATLVATGGSTPGPAYDRLSQEDLDWSRITVTLSDERWVDPSSQDSNERLVRGRLLQGPAATARFIPLKRDGETPEDDAALACAALEALAPPLDLVLLGMGEDGHIASLFPMNEALAAGLAPSAPPCIAVPKGYGRRPPPQPRLSLSLPWLKSARRIIIMFAGSRKFDVLEAAMRRPDPHLYPVCAILTAPAGVQVICAS